MFSRFLGVADQSQQRAVRVDEGADAQPRGLEAGQVQPRPPVAGDGQPGLAASRLDERITSSRRRQHPKELVAGSRSGEGEELEGQTVASRGIQPSSRYSSAKPK